MNKRLFSTLLVVSLAVAATAQDIDFDFPGRNSSEVTEPNFTPWPVGRVESDQKVLDNGITITIAAGDDATALASNWNKNIVQQSSKLLGDGVFTCHLDNGNYVWITEGRTAIVLTIEGMSAGRHSLLAYHNNTDNGLTLPDVEVSVNGVVQVTGAKYTSGATKLSDAGSSYVEFDVADGQPVVIKYATTPEAGVTYTRTSLMLNGLEFDANPYGIQDPLPENYDYHVNADGGSLTLSWVPASVAVQHRLVLGTDSAEVANATVYDYEGTEPQYTPTGLSPLVRYWWRVDEVEANGTTYKGRVLCFQPRRLAFPGAEGYGRFAIGGRGGVVYHVTTLDDNGDDAAPLPGSFRYGIKAVKGPRTIVFDVAGVIHLKSRLTCSDRFVTIAGQTAPGRGIMFRGAPFGMQSDGITRFIRARRGHIIDEEDANKGLDGLGMAGNDHAIMDHCSISWTIDEGFSSRNAKNVTLQRTLISEALNVANHPNYGSGKAHGFAATIGGGEMGGLGSSYHHNLLAHNEGRNWSLSGGLDGKGYYDGHHDVFNNVVYNWGGRATDGGTHELNFVGNYYKKGPATTQNFLLRHQFEGTGLGSQAAYVSGNIREELNGSQTQDAEGVTYRYELSGGQVLDWEPWATEPFFPSYATVQTAEEAYQDVLSDVGCNLPEPDNHDQRMIQETLSRTTTTTGSKSGKKGLIDHEDDSEGYGGLNITEAHRAADWDTDQDGIPDWFETIVGTDPSTPNNNDCHDGTYHYTDLEVYLNWMAQPNFVLALGEERVIDLKPYFAGLGDFEVVDDGARTDDGFLWDFDGTSLTVKDLMDARLKTLQVEVRNPKTGYAMTRRFHFATTGGVAGIGSADSHAGATPSAPVYNLHGQQLAAPRRGLNIQSGKKFVKK